MANEYEQYSLIQQISQSGHGAEGLLDSYRKGVEWKQNQEDAAKESKLKDIAIQQAKASEQATQLQNQQKSLEVEHLQKMEPLWDASLTIKLNQISHDLEIQPDNLKLATLKIHDELKSYPVEERAAHLGALNQLVSSLTPDNYEQVITSPDMQDMAKEFHLTGDWNKDQSMLKAIHAGVLAAPKVQAQLAAKQIEAEGKVAVEQAKDARSQAKIASTERIAAYKGSVELQKAAMANLAKDKITLPTKNELIGAKAQLTSDPYFKDFTDEADINGLSSLYVSLTKSQLQAAKASGVAMTVTDAQVIALDKLKAGSEIATPGSDGFVDRVFNLFGKTTKRVPSLKEAAGSTKRTVVRTGKDASGKKVVQYDDGTVEYAK